MIQELLQTQFIFVQGKGGVGKTSVSRSLAHLLSTKYRTVWVTIEDPTQRPGAKILVHPQLDYLNNEPLEAFEEYAGLKIGVPSLVRVFLQNKLMQYLAKATPGLKELVLVGKIWHQRLSYERVVVDMPATGHGLTMFQSICNWENLFKGSILSKDARAMMETFQDPKQTSHLIVSLPEEMPLIESLELKSGVENIFPDPRIGLVVNRLFPEIKETLPPSQAPYSETFLEQASRRSQLERENLKLWNGLSFDQIPFFVPAIEKSHQKVEEQMLAHYQSIGLKP